MSISSHIRLHQSAQLESEYAEDDFITFQLSQQQHLGDCSDSVWEKSRSSADVWICLDLLCALKSALNVFYLHIDFKLQQYRHSFDKSMPLRVDVLATFMHAPLPFLTRWLWSHDFCIWMHYRRWRKNWHMSWSLSLRFNYVTYSNLPTACYNIHSITLEAHLRLTWSWKCVILTVYKWHRFILTPHRFQHRLVNTHRLQFL